MQFLKDSTPTSVILSVKLNVYKLVQFSNILLGIIVIVLGSITSLRLVQLVNTYSSID